MQVSNWTHMEFQVFEIQPPVNTEWVSIKDYLHQLIIVQWYNLRDEVSTLKRLITLAIDNNINDFFTNNGTGSATTKRIERLEIRNPEVSKSIIDGWFASKQ